MRPRWLSKRALLLHLALLAWFPGCLVAGWWQVHRALSGNTLSYVYSIEWPAFALAGVFAWWLLIHIDSSTPGHTVGEQLLAARRAGAATPTGRRGTSRLPVARREAGVGDLLLAHREALAGATAAATGTAAATATPHAVAVATTARREKAGARIARTQRRDQDVEKELAVYNERLARLSTGGLETWRRR